MKLIISFLAITFSYYTMAQSIDFIGKTDDGDMCHVTVETHAGTGNYSYYFYEDNDLEFESTHKIDSVEYNLIEFGIYTGTVIQEGWFNRKKHYEVEIVGELNSPKYFRVIRWRYLTGSGFGTPFTKYLCITK